MQEKDNNNPGMYLLRKSHRGILRLIFSRTFLVVILLLLQVLLQVSFLFWFKTFLPHYYIIVLVYTVMIVLYLINSSIDPSAKITWLVIMMILPFLGAVLFGFTQSNLGHRVLKKSWIRRSATRCTVWTKMRKRGLILARSIRLERH